MFQLHQRTLAGLGEVAVEERPEHLLLCFFRCCCFPLIGALTLAARAEADDAGRGAGPYETINERNTESRITVQDVFMSLKPFSISFSFKKLSILVAWDESVGMHTLTTLIGIHRVFS